MKIKRNIITPYLAFLFLVVGLSGTLMFFHLFDDYTAVVHELLGMAFVVFSVLHLIINWKSMKSHFKKRVFIFSGMIILVFTILFVSAGKMHGNLEYDVIDKLIKSPVSHSFHVLNKDYHQAESILEENNIIVGASETIEEICVNNRTSPKKILELLVK